MGAEIIFIQALVTLFDYTNFDEELTSL
jgi:hypothetical protein